MCLLRRLVFFVASLEQFPLPYWDPASLPDILFGRINRKHHQNIPYIVQNIVQNHHYQLTFEVMKQKFVPPTSEVEKNHHQRLILLLTIKLLRIFRVLVLRLYHRPIERLRTPFSTLLFNLVLLLRKKKVKVPKNQVLLLPYLVLLQPTIPIRVLVRVLLFSNSIVVLGQVPRNITYNNNNNNNIYDDNKLMLMLMLMPKIFDFIIIESHTTTSATIYNITTIVVDDIKCTTNRSTMGTTTIFDTVIEFQSIKEEENDRTTIDIDSCTPTNKSTTGTNTDDRSTEVEVCTIIDDEFDALCTATCTIIDDRFDTLCTTICNTTISGYEFYNMCTTIFNTVRNTPYIVQEYSKHVNILYIIQDTIQISLNGEPYTVQYSKSWNSVRDDDFDTHDDQYCVQDDVF